jgi:undecaprenyl-diphosphatase
VFIGLSWSGTFGLAWIVLALVLAIVLRRPGLVPLTAAAILVAEVVALALKHAFSIERPPLRYPEPPALVRVPTDGSFPSGHAATSFACALLFSFAWPRFTPIFVLLATAIGFSRVYVGVHYPLDIVGGAVVGAAVATALRLLAGDLLRSRRAPPAG